MSKWGSCKAKKLLKALYKIGWKLKREGKGSHRLLEREGFPDYTWSFHDDQEIGPKMLSRVSKHTGLRPEDL
jgi:predicted RNA binding protein YcfA (HicA-like mRNA interferase family)